MIRPDPEKEAEIIEKVREGELDLNQAFHEFDKLDSKVGLEPFVFEENKPVSTPLAFATKQITIIRQALEKIRSGSKKNQGPK
ncbi:MAG TPA: hypothetical protein ENI11_01935 [Actinobacteria bacterium]|nr:hypothetical protein [Actinomycetota bacterium]